MNSGLVNNNVFLSVIIPTFNSEENISKCIESVLCQSFSDFEILIMDGGSSDKSIEILKSFNDDRVKIFSEKDLGVYDAMNKGILRATGDWLYFLGSDDVFYSNDILLKISDKINVCNSDVIYGNVLIDGSCSWANDKEVYAGEFSFNKLYKHNICHQSIFYNRSFILQNELSFNLEFPVSSDWDFNLKAWLISEFVYLDIIVAVFKTGGISSKFSDNFDAFKKDVYKTHQDFRISKRINFFLKSILKKK